MRRIYLDYAATTPVDPRVVKAMGPYLSEQFGNPGSLHSFGQEASAAVFKSRQMIAAELGCHYSEIIFTGSATEANNLALRGAVRGWQRAKSKEQRGSKLFAVGHLPFAPRIIISAVEHESILNTAQDLARDGADVVIIPVSKEGILDVKKLKSALNEQTALVSIMYGNNEVGTIQPIAEIAKIIQGFRGQGSGDRKNSLHPVPLSLYPLFHTDAVQAFQYLDCNMAQLGVDLLTLSGQKIYGPKGIGALYVRGQGTGNRVQSKLNLYPAPLTLHPIITGGGQEAGLRSGTENVPVIVGFAKAVELAAKVREKEAERVAMLRVATWQGIKKIFPKAVLNGPSLDIPIFSRMSECRRLPNNLNFYLPGISGEQLLVALDLQGIAVSSGSACSARSIDPSHVLLAMGYNKERAKNSIRISLGRMTTKQEIAKFLGILKKVIAN